MSRSKLMTLFLAAVCASVAAWAHPHVWVTVETEVVYDELYRDVSPISLLESVSIRVRHCPRGTYQPGWQDPRAES